MHVDVYDKDTFLPILKELDYPYSEKDWEKTRDNHIIKYPNNINPTSIFGKYVSRMKLTQWNDKTWKDTAALEDEAKDLDIIKEDKRREYEEDIRDRFEKGIINEVEYNALMQRSDAKEEETKERAKLIYNNSLIKKDLMSSMGVGNAYDESQFVSLEDLPDPTEELTDDDKKYLASKWGRLYRPYEWIELEKKYEEMSRSFSVQDSDTVSALILICKTYLKLNQAIDTGDIQTYQQLSRVYDNLRKSSKFKCGL